jgi:hypothetical protein
MSYPIIRLQVEGMKHSILTAISAKHDDIEKIIETEISKINIEEIIIAEVRKTVPAAIEAAIQDQVRQGVRQAIDHEMIFSTHLSKKLSEVVCDHLDSRKKQ